MILNFPKKEAHHISDWTRSLFACISLRDYECVRTWQGHSVRQPSLVTHTHSEAKCFSLLAACLSMLLLRLCEHPGAWDGRQGILKLQRCGVLMFELRACLNVCLPAFVCEHSEEISVIFSQCFVSKSGAIAVSKLSLSKTPVTHLPRPAAYTKLEMPPSPFLSVFVTVCFPVRVAQKFYYWVRAAVHLWFILSSNDFFFYYWGINSNDFPLEHLYSPSVYSCPQLHHLSDWLQHQVAWLID